MSGWRRPASVAAVAVVVVAAIVVVILIGRGGKSGGQSTPGQPGSPGPAAAAQVIPAPARGAYFGAWVKPAQYTQQDYLAAVDRLQQQIGRRLDIVHIYLQQDAMFPTSSEM